MYFAHLATKPGSQVSIFIAQNTHCTLTCLCSPNHHYLSLVNLTFIVSCTFWPMDWMPFAVSVSDVCTYRCPVFPIHQWHIFPRHMTVIMPIVLFLFTLTLHEHLERFSQPQQYFLLCVHSFRMKLTFNMEVVMTFVVLNFYHFC